MKKTSIFAASIFFMLILINPSYAYLDPGSGSMMLQLVLGGLAGLGVLLKVFWGRILSLLGLGKKTEKKPDSTPS